MKFYSAITFSAFASLSKTQAHSAPPPNMMYDICFWSTNNSAPLFSAIQNQCDNSYDCTGVDTSALSCDVWEQNDLLFFEEPDLQCKRNMTVEEMESIREEMEDTREAVFDALMVMTEEERNAFHEEQQVTDEANAATVLGCGCCIGMESIEKLVDGREGRVAKTLKLRPKRDGPVGDGPNDAKFGEGFGRGPGMGGAMREPDGFGFRGGSRHGSSHSGDMMFQEMILSKCDAFDCTGVDESNTNCTIGGGPRERHDFMDVSEEEKELHHQQFLSCMCCIHNETDFMFEDEPDFDELDEDETEGEGTDTMAFMSSSLVQNADASAESQSVDNPANGVGLSMIIALASIGAIVVLI